MSTPDASAFTRRKRDLAMLNGVQVNSTKSRASAFFYRSAGAVFLPNFLSSPIKNRQLPPPNRITLGQPFLAKAEVSAQYGLGSVYLSKVPTKFIASTQGLYTLDYSGGNETLFLEVLESTTPETAFVDRVRNIAPNEVIPLTAGQVVPLMFLNGEGSAEVTLTITKVELPIITLNQPFLAKAEVLIFYENDGTFYISTLPGLFTAPENGGYILNYIEGSHAFVKVKETTRPETYLDDLTEKGIRPGSVISLTAGQILPLMLESGTEGEEVTLTITKAEQNVITLNQPFLAKAEAALGFGNTYISTVPALFTASEAGNYKLNFIADQSNFAQVLRTTTPQTFNDDAVDQALRSNAIILLTAGQVLPLMYLSASGIAETTLTITKVESNVITLGQPFTVKAEAPVDTGDGIIYVSTTPALFTVPSSGAYSLNYTGGRNIFLQVLEETTPESIEGDIVRGFPPGNIVILASGEVLPLMLQSTVQDTEISLTITQQELISDITKSAPTLVTYNDYDWRVSNTPSDFTASRDGVYVLNFDFPSTRVRKVSQNTTPQTTFDIENESLDDPPINVYLESGDVFYFMTYYDAQDGERGTNVIVTRRPVFTGSLVLNQEELIPCKTAVALNIDQPESYQTDFIGNFFTTATSFSFEAPRDGQYEIFQPGAKRANFIPLARVQENTTAATLESHQTEIIEDFNSIFNLTQGQKIYLMPIASTEGEILSVIIWEFSGDSGPGPDGVPDPGPDDDL